MAKSLKDLASSVGDLFKNSPANDIFGSVRSFVANTPQPVKNAIYGGVPITQAQKAIGQARNMINAYKGYGELLGSAAQTGANALLEPITKNPATIRAIPEQTLAQYQHDPSMGAARPLFTGGMQTAGALFATAMPKIAASNPLPYIANSLVSNAALQGSGELLKGLRTKTPLPQTLQNAARGVAGESNISGPLAGLIGENPATLAADTILSFLIPNVASSKRETIANDMEQARDSMGRYSFKKVVEKLGNKLDEIRVNTYDPEQNKMVNISMREYMQMHNKGGFVDFNAAVGLPKIPKKGQAGTGSIEPVQQQQAQAGSAGMPPVSRETGIAGTSILDQTLLPNEKSTLSSSVAQDTTREKQILQQGMQSGIGQRQSTESNPFSLSGKIPTQEQVSVLPKDQKVYTGWRQLDQASEDIIAQGRKSIGSNQEKTDKRSIGQVFSDLRTQWVDRNNPIIKIADKVSANLKNINAVLRPENNPKYLLKRLAGAGSIADSRFRNELEPIIKKAESLKIDKTDLDTYLAHKRMAGFGVVGRDIYGADPEKSKKIVSALESKYGTQLSDIANELYQYQSRGLQELVDAGFISPDVAKTMMKENPDYSPLYRVMDEVDNYLGIPTRKTMQSQQPIKKIKGSDRQIDSPIESIIGNTFSQRAAIEKNRVAKSIVDLGRIDQSIGFKKVSESGQDTITVWNNGKKEFYQVGKDIADVARGVNEESMNMILKILQAPASLLRQGATGRNPEFMLPNIIRDQLDAGVSSKYGYIPFVDYLSGLKSMLSNDEIYKRWEASGAKIDLGEMSGKKSIHQYFLDKTKKKNILDWLSAGLDVMGKYSEQPTRVGLFKKAYQKTGNELLSVMDSRDATIDFNTMGSKMKVANSIIPFLNVGVQGFDKIIRSVKDNPSKVALTAATYGLLPQLATTIYNLQNHASEYSEIPQYEKDNNFIFIIGRNNKGTVDYVTLPKGNILPYITNPAQSLLEYAYQVNNQSIGQIATSLLSDSLPVLAPGSSPKEVALKTIGSNLPQLVKPAAEALLNKSFYKYDAKNEQARDIVPYFLQKEQPYNQKFDFTPIAYQKIGALINVSPLIVQNTLEGYLAGYSKIPSQIIEMLAKFSRGDEINTNEKTILRRFIKETNPNSNTENIQQPQAPATMERLFGKVKAYEQSPEAPKTIPQKIVLAAQGIGVDPENTIKAIFTEERMRKISGNAMILERQQFLNTTKDKTDAVDHIIPLSLGGTNDPSNLRYISKEANAEKAKLESKLSKELSQGKITKEEARKQVQDWVSKYDTGARKTDLKIQIKGSKKTIDTTFTPVQPNKTGNETIDKTAMSEYNSAIAKKARDIYQQYKLSASGEIKPGETGYMTAEMADSELKKLEEMKQSTKTKTKKPKKITIKKVSPKRRTINIKSQNVKPIKFIRFTKTPPKQSGGKQTIAIRSIKPITVKTLKGLTVSHRLV